MMDYIQSNSRMALYGNHLTWLSAAPACYHRYAYTNCFKDIPVEANQAIASGAEGSVNRLIGLSNQNFSALSVGDTYYFKEGFTLTNVPTNLKAGVAISSSQIAWDVKRV